MAERRRAARAGAGPRVDPARDAAYAVLKAVRVDDAYANLVLPEALAAHDLSGRDAALATELAAGTLRGRGTYDAILDACTDKPIARTPAKVLDALRLGVHQVLAMRVPDHAAISTTVDLVRARANPGSAGFANAVLRRVAARTMEEWLDQVAPVADRSDRALGVRHSHPTWVVGELRRALTAADAGRELPALLGADNTAPRVTLVARPGRSTRQELPGEPTVLSPYGVVSDGGDPGELAAVREGRAGVQDEGSQLVAHALAQVAVQQVPGRAERWLDLCAGPGGKAALLAAIAAERGAVLVSNEAQHHRSLLVRRAVRGTPAARRLVTGDGTRPPWAPGTFDRVLLDAPCSGLGALRRRPESRWRRTPADVADLVGLQRTLLDRALDSVRVGGVVAYATCSPVVAETAEIVTAALDARKEVELVPDPLPGVPDAAGPLAGTAQLWPHRHGTDAMFVALLRRTR
ncbi:rRNA cytosine-C5-methyltransferase [Nocardioidaceae bacterium]|nr:rRNA cytosine-C5-methyltransferase [Nocardioidaceae bacterium]